MVFVIYSTDDVGMIDARELGASANQAVFMKREQQTLMLRQLTALKQFQAIQKNKI